MSTFLLTIRDNPSPAKTCGGNSRSIKEAKIPESRTLHGMRHRRVTGWLEDGWTLSEAKDMAGHTKIEMTDSVYTHLEAKNLKRKMERIEARTK